MKAFAAYIDVPYAMAVSSVRDGFSCLLDVLDFQPGDEIILAAYNYHVMPMILKKRGLVPVFADIDPGTLNIDAAKIESCLSEKTRAVIVTHLFGRAAPVAEIQKICRQHNLLLLEDAAHACGAECQGQKVGGFGDFGMFSFGTGKCLVTLGGGMIVARNAALFDQLKLRLDRRDRPGQRWKSTCYYLKSLLQITFTNRTLFAGLVYPWLLFTSLFRFDLIERLTGDKYTSADVSAKSEVQPFSEFQAVLGLSQLKRLDVMNDRRIALAQLLDRHLKEVKELKRFRMEGGREHIVLSYTVMSEDKNKLRQHLLWKGIDTKESSMRNCALFMGNDGAYPGMAQVDDRIIELPCSQYLGEAEILYQANVIRTYFGYRPVTTRDGTMV
ncbi:MAG: aminotransferase class I/II-fold pyridoxal phosphate-dependent enzyme [Candidatus Omnitrophica bacterium]|nr:aminotransferase class I/II-fold pyridoxal phosphate-dependent enzyme [Candidatus Omnitrophota bacterium]